MKVNSYSALTNSISGTVDADATSATICWQWKGECDDDKCNPSIITGTSCETIPLTPNDTCSAVTSSSSITWNNESINYTITQNPKTEGCDECSANTTYQLIDSWLDKSVFSNCEDGCGCDAITIDGQQGLMASSNGGDKATLYYRYYEITKGKNCPITRTEKIGSTDEIYTECEHSYIVSKKSGTTNISGMTVPYTYYCDKCDECEPNKTKIYIGNISYDKEYLLCNDSAFTYSVNYQVVYYDEDCKKTITDKVKRDTIILDKCSGSACCEDHYVESSITISEVVDEETITTDVNLKMLVKGDYNGACYSGCNSACTYETKYCIIGDSCGCDALLFGEDNNSEEDNKNDNTNGTVLYPYTDEYGNPQWVKKGDDGYKPVPYQGGDVRVRFSYIVHTRLTDCTETEGSGTTYEVIQVPSINCDEVFGENATFGNASEDTINVDIVIKYGNPISGDCNEVRAVAIQKKPTREECGIDDCECLEIK